MSKFAYVGTYSHPNGKGKGIHVYSISGTGEWKSIQEVPSNSSSFLCFNRKGDRLYVANELNEREGQQGEVASFKVDKATGLLTFLNSYSSLGIWPCHIILDPTEKYVLCSNYFSGSVIVLPVESDGSLGRYSDLLVNKGSGPNQARQQGPHAHQVIFDVEGKRALLVDLGIDKTLFCNLDLESGKLVPQPGHSLNIHPGAGPRHVAQHNNGRFYYVINELDNTLSVFSGTEPYTTLQTVPTVPKDAGKSACAELTLHPNGKFLYGSNRGHDSIVIFSVNEQSGLVTLVGYEPTQGQIPRHFFIDTEGKFLYVANQNSDNVVAFKIDPSSGKLTSIGVKAEVPTPICVIVT